jgi:GT2 family glycosyltransferase
VSQTNSNWELLIFENLNNDFFFTQSIEYENSKIRRFKAANDPLIFLLEKAKGEFFVCCNSGDIFEKHFIEEFYKTIKTFLNADIVYSDIDEYSNNLKDNIPLFKPDTYSQELHLSINYLSRSLIKKSSALAHINSIISNICLLAQEWDLLFLLKENGAIDYHIPYVLIHQYIGNKFNQEQINQVLRNHLNRIGISVNDNSIKSVNQQISLVWDFGNPSVSIIVPTKNNYKLLRNLIESIFSITIYKNFEVILVDNNSTDKKVLSYYNEIEKKYPIKNIKFDKAFNFSKAINFGASFSRSDLLLFMNNDMEVFEPNWLSELCQWAMLPGVGVVGPKLLYKDKSIQHAGVILGLQGFVGHIFLHAPEHYFGLNGSVDWYRNYSAVTGACQILRRNVFYEIGCYDEEFQLVFSDIEFCLRAKKNGYRNIYTPNSVLIHHEGKSRGISIPQKDILRANELFSSWLNEGDPYFSPNLTYTTIPNCKWEKK